MQCDHALTLLTDRWAGTLSDADRRRLDAHLDGCESCRAEAAGLTDTWQALGRLSDEMPSHGLEQRFDAMLSAWREGESSAAARRAPAPGRGRSFWSGWSLQPAWQLATAALLVTAGVGLGHLMTARSDNAGLIELQTEVRHMRQMVAVSLLQQQSATERLRGAEFTSSLDHPGGEVIGVLVQTLQHDNNVNVRLAAIDALERFATDARARDGLINAMSGQESPIVQIALIDALVDLNDPRSKPALESVARAERVNAAVRRHASQGLRQL